jgi:hypothetical protein
LNLGLLHIYAERDSPLERAIPPLRVATSLKFGLALLLLFLLTLENEVPRLIGDLNITLLHPRKLSLNTNLPFIFRNGNLWLKFSVTKRSETDGLPHILKS